MAEWHSPYLKHLDEDDKRSIVKKIVPGALLAYRMRRRYRRLFPGAFVSSEASVASNARIGTGCIVRTGCRLSGSVNLGRYSTLGDDCLLRGGGRIEIGPFCSIGPEVVMISENHLLERFTTFPLSLYSSATFTEDEFVASDIGIGADVWVGQRAIILAGARIATGCVIGAGSVVTRGEYEPFTVLAGVPARTIRKRLDDKSRETLLASRWWEGSPDSIFGEQPSILKQSRLDDSTSPKFD